MARIEANRIKGLVPALDNKKLTQPVVLAGENFIVEVDGPCSVFGRLEVSHLLLSNPLYAQAFTTEADVASWIFTSGCILRYDGLTDTAIPVYVFTEPADKFPWSMALVGGKYYFARRGVGLIEYDPTPHTWKLVDGTTYGSSIPANIVGCCETDGRLVVVAQGLAAWSAIDSGTNMTPSTTTGAGFQSLALIGSFSLDSVLGVVRVNDGFLTLTRNGIMKSSVTHTIVTFRHKKLSTAHVPINHYCFVQTRDDNVLYLAEDGFYQTSGEVPEVWQPLMSEYFHKSIIEPRNSVANGQIKLDYIATKNWVFASIAENEQASIYTKSYVWNGKLDEWGSFDRLHTGVFEFTVATGTIAGTGIFHFDEFGNFYKIVGSSSDSLAPILTYSQFNYRPVVQIEARTEGAIRKMPSVVGFYDIDESRLALAGYYDKWAEKEKVIEVNNGTTGGHATYNSGGVSLFGSTYLITDGLLQTYLAQVPNRLTSLDAFIHVGPFRLLVNEVVAEYATVTDVMLGMLDSSSGVTTFEDWLTFVNVTEDWNTITPNVYEDWGLASTISGACTASISASIDGYIPLEGQEQELSLLETDGRVKLFTCYSTGIFHEIQVETIDANAYFCLKTLELTGFAAGRAF